MTSFRSFWGYPFPKIRLIRCRLLSSTSFTFPLFPNKQLYNKAMREKGETMAYETILTEERNGVLLITFNRPKARNAMSSLMMEEFSSELERWDNDPTQRCCIITNAGTCFCAGADLKELAAGTYHLPKGKENWGLLGMSKHRFKKPLIAAVNGVCVGGGLGLVLACDIAIASSHSVFGLPEARHGRASTGDGAILRLMQQIPQKYAAELILVGDNIDAEKLTNGV